MVGPITAQEERLRPLLPFVPAARMPNEYLNGTFELYNGLTINGSTLNDNPSYTSLSQNPVARRPAWVRLNCLLTDVGRYQSPCTNEDLLLHEICQCGTLYQTAACVIVDGLIHYAPKGYHGLLVLDDKTRCRLNNVATNI